MRLRIRINGVADAGTNRGPRGDPDRAAELRDLLTRAARAAFEAHGVADAELSVTLVDDAGSAELNERYLDRDGPTDVIAFPLHAAEEPPLGDVYIGAEQARRQAEALGVEPAEELVRLAVHGTLHVLGHEHPEGPERERSRMWALQERLVSEAVGR